MQGEPSEAIRERVIHARNIQEQRFRALSSSDKQGGTIHCNAQMTDHMLHDYCQLDEPTYNMLHTAMIKMNLFSRVYSRILKVARTIADLEGKESIEMHHVAEAVGYHSLDRGDWAER